MWVQWRMKHSYLSISIVVLLTWSCQKDEAFQELGNTQKKLGTNLWTQAVNEQNPYESQYFGIYHNHSINYFRDQRQYYESDTAWASDVYKVTLDYFCGGSDTRYCVSGLLASQLQALSDTALSDSLFDICVSVTSIDVRDYIDECVQLFDQYSMSQYSSLWQSIVDLEYQVANDSSLSQDEKKLILGATQIARYSGIYWKEEIESGFNDWGSLNFSVTEADYARLAEVDIRGAVVGNIAGAAEDDSESYAANSGPTASKSYLLEFMQ